ncbi:LicD family protein [Atopobiaceae bacterium HCP3S3_F7]|nr:LicD family protein [Olsenella sp.]
MEKVRGCSVREHQLCLLGMLKDLDALCRDNGIVYQLFAGSALGVVRHGGFIPWDDDLDVVMLRADYDRFLDVASHQLDTGTYFVQAEFSEHWPMQFSKLRKNGTACIERYRPRDPQTHQGVYIDVFPCDNLADGALAARVQFLASKVVIAKCLDARGYITDSRLKKAFMGACRALPLEPNRRAVMRGEDVRSRRVHTFFGASRRFERAIYPREWLTETVRLPFEDGLFPVSAHYDELLRTLYGDYMTPSPEGERAQKVHAVLVDLDHSYEEYVGIQDSMEFDVLTRSIR